MVYDHVGGVPSKYAASEIRGEGAHDERQPERTKK